MLKRAVSLSLATALALQTPSALARAPVPEEEDELALVYGGNSQISIATGSTQLLRRAPAVATVITARDIAAMGATDLDQVLESVAGLHVNRSANQYAPLYVVRGIFSQFGSQLVLLQNGIPVTSSYLNNKGNLWGGYPVEHIARIEVLRGPGSALYGSDAYSGVVNIITKTAADAAGTELGGRAGSFATRDAWLQHGGSWGPADVAAYVRVGHTDGQRRRIDADAQSRNDTLFGTHASLAGGPVNLNADALDINLDIGLDQWRWRAGYKFRDDLGTGAGVASALDPVGRSRSARLTSDLSWTAPQLARDWSAGATLSILVYHQRTPTDYQLLPPGTRLPTGVFSNGMFGGPDFDERTLRIGAYLAYAGAKRHNLRLGAGHDDLNLYRSQETRNFTYTASGLPIPQPAVIDYSDSDPYIRPNRRQLDYLYLQDEWRFVPDWTLTAGVRHDRYSDFGATTNPRLALVWDASLDLTAKLLYGRAFRAPAFLESYGRSNPVTTGNPALRPETNNTLEAVLAWQVGADTHLNATLYRYAMGSIIRTVPNAQAGTGSTYNNTGDQDGHGLELEARHGVTRDLHLTANYSWQKSTDKASGLDAGYAPTHHLYSRADWQFDDAWMASAQLNLVAGRKRPPGDARAPVADYTTLDLVLRSTRKRGHWSVSAGLLNVFDADAREPSLGPGLQIPHDLPLAPRSWSVQASYQL